MEEECILIQQDEEGSNWWKCSKCKFDFYWGESGEDVKDSELNYCPSCGSRIKEYSFIIEFEED